MLFYCALFTTMIVYTSLSIYGDALQRECYDRCHKTHTKCDGTIYDNYSISLGFETNNKVDCYTYDEGRFSVNGTHNLCIPMCNYLGENRMGL